MLDTRSEIRRIIGSVQPSSYRRLSLILGCTVFAMAIAFIPGYPGLAEPARWAFFILLLAASMWVTEALPAFAVALLVISLEIGILGVDGGVFAESSTDWEVFVAPWASSLMWLFFGGLILAQAASKTGLDRLIAHQVLRLVGGKPAMLLVGLMSTTFVLSMFMSNTATTAMMMAVIAPIVANISTKNPFAKAVLLGIPFAANIGGMGTIIGSPPNAIAAAAIQSVSPIDFVDWMLLGLPPALLLLVVAWAYLMFSYRSTEARIGVVSMQSDQASDVPHWKMVVVLVTFLLTVALWLTTPLHHLPTSMISFLPIGVFSIIHLLEPQDIRALNWDVLLLLAGGLSLGVMVSETGLADWLINGLPIQGWSLMGLAFGFSYLTMAVSNFMSNTAAANIIVPLAAVAAGQFAPQVVVPVALGASAAMCLPISTPPNAIAFTSGRLQSTDFVRGGIVVGIAAPLLGVLWCSFVL